MFERLKQKFREFTKSIEKKVQEVKTVVTEGEVILDSKDLEEPLEELEFALLESDVALPVAESIIEAVRNELIGRRKKLLKSTEVVVRDALREALLKTLFPYEFDFDEFVERCERPVRIVFVGVNGTGKTTTIAKVAKRLLDNGYSVVLACADTFRAGAAEQLETHARNLGVKLIKHQYGADPAAVVYDAVEYARAHRRDVVLADTAGRMHTNINLMEQLRKICRVNSPHLKIFVDEAVAGNDAVERATRFNDAIGIDATILTKLDADPKGGAAISIAYVTGKPIIFVGTGQGYDDLQKFDAAWLIERILG